MKTDSEHWQGRVKVEQILEVGCPKCGAKPHAWCDRTGDKLSKRGQALAKAGTPPSHTERMWKRQGHGEHEFPGLRAKQRPGLWDESAPAPGLRTPRDPAPRGGCGPCASERKIREKLNSPNFPVDFPCRHPRPEDIVVPGFPLRYSMDVICPGCRVLHSAEVVVQDPWTVGYRCGKCGHKWLATAPRKPSAAPARPVPVLAGRTGRKVAGDGEDRAPWE